MANSRNSTSPSRIRLDFGTLFGLLLATACIAGGLLFEGGKIADIRQGTAAMIVLGGTLGAVLVTTPLPVFLSAMKRAAATVIQPRSRFEETLETMIQLAERARRGGLASLELEPPEADEASDVSDPFLRKALNLAADGTDLRTLRDMMQMDADIEMDHAEEEAKVWESAAGYAPTIGIIGAVLGLIQVMKHLENLDEVGRGIAVAFVATVYGVFSANVIFLPIAGKLKWHSRELARLREMMVDGVIAIAEGINPRLLRVRFDALVPAKMPELITRRPAKPITSTATVSESL